MMQILQTCIWFGCLQGLKRKFTNKVLKMILDTLHKQTRSVSLYINRPKSDRCIQNISIPILLSSPPAPPLQKLSEILANLSTMEAKSTHPLHQIAQTPTHKLLLKQWLKEEDLILNRISLKETQIDSVRKEITNLYCLFFLFHSISLLLLFNASSNDVHGAACRRSWIPSVCSLVFSLGMIWAVRYKIDVEAHMEKMLEREKEDGTLLGKCVDELKKKGLEFDLLKEVDALRRAKSLRVEAKVVKKWSARDFVTLFFFTVSCLILGLIRVILC